MLIQVFSFRRAVVIFILATLVNPQVSRAGEPGNTQGQADISGVTVEVVENPGVPTRTVDRMRLFTQRHNMTAIEMVEQTQGLATRLGMSLIRAGGERDGPLHILFETRQAQAGQKQALLLGFPSRGNPRSSGRHRLISTSPFYCSYIAYEGPADGITAAWAELVKSTQNAGYTPNGQGRYVFTCDGNCTKERTSVELQLGIE